MTSLRVVAMLMVLVAAAGRCAAEGAPELDYALDDQFATTHTEEDCGEAVVILLGGDRKGSTYIDEWGPSLHRALETELETRTVCSVGFAHLKGAPFFVKKKIVASFPKDPDSWILLDWKGVISKNWGAEKNAANLYVFDQGGELVNHVSLREFDQEVLDLILNVVQETVAEE
jgi:hypothetical protein